MTDLLNQPPNLAMLAGAVVIDELVALGVSEIVLCPGSRSAPLAYAAWAGDQAGRLRLWVRTDERAAAYFALGLAKASGRAVAVVTTSGTAVANLAPALLEARHAGLPLLACTADRPASLVGTGANQTTDQLALLAPVALSTIRIASTEAVPAAWRQAVRRAVVTAEGRLSRQPGPVHVNVELTPPLVGDPGPLPLGGPFRLDPPPGPRPVRLDPGPRTVVVAGDLPPQTGRDWAARAAQAGLPLLAEPSSNARTGPAAIRFARLLVPELGRSIERVVLVGRPTLSRALLGLLARADLEIIAVAPGATWVDPGWAVSRVVPDLTLAVGDPAWLAAWQRADRRLGESADPLIRDSPELNGPSLAAIVNASLSAEENLVLGPSQPIRDADLAPISDQPPLVYANRGQAGIDGVIATALGLAAASGRPTTALLGDLTFLHDLTALVVPELERRLDLRLVVADDNGGSIFNGLEYGAGPARLGPWADAFERCFAVPSGQDLARIGSALGCQVESVDSPQSLRQALDRPSAGLRLIVASLRRDNRRSIDAQLTKLVRPAAA
ncbi:MAG: 2-succinyl-5-enolpyruvyl-6-hydroxy-3-cyclohexene-1-carboxylic-acid synthase [Propionibacteriaceae bacterium]|jgi:2-succinyl-5-enolpyruvyl-6-hydroxy-3-cyclohexene-1-carboxylate synthase|nr:2-succinyl-5-enolpyruvyl-6-hydroxy-3-cyclohexene-1-carboxylic-acid synthase [Propionibacteriaceae bacterium]